MWDLLLQNIEDKNVPLTGREKSIIREAFLYRKFRKNQYVMQQHDTARYEIFVVRGMLRTFIVDNKGTEHVLQFSPEDWWAGDLYSFFSGNPTSYSIDCLEHSEVLLITKEGLGLLYEQVPKMYAYFCKLYTNSIAAHNRRIASTLCQTAPERYLDFRKRYPDIEQRIPNRHIASFLGITPQSLSRIRKQLVKDGN
ncbi:hypothetical protein CHU92_00820 [Flavobacterium cyanobacteriorum]|uniref:Cyclic nucleotide-binding domain-containing protein n=1 Tax=Flavobacterium cyanobacteriorum TaxID=2022802 RepID=A0A256A551_9FLAO|nr:Crp/Fnr family transcriptional regulator [Flavobacterium cyanobacteriorum]OYQ48225.1 hypothetical protein CHU92_00820 [Flavobacterium cyanobacteriorum]